MSLRSCEQELLALLNIWRTIANRDLVMSKVEAGELEQMRLIGRARGLFNAADDLEAWIREE